MTDYRLPINYLDSGRVARDKINDSFNEVVEKVIGYRPHIENGIWWIGTTNTGVKAEGDSVTMKVENGYIWYKSDSKDWTQIIAVADLKGDKGDPGTDAWEYMTQEQYDELPDTKLTDGISRAIIDDVSGVLKVLLRAENNTLHYNDDDELYSDLQFENGLTPTSAFPIGISVGNVDSNDGWTQSGVLMNALATDGTYMRWLYGDDGKLYFDGGLGVFKTIATTDDITTALSSLRNELSDVAFTGKSSDLNNDAGFNSVPIMTQAQYDQQSGTASDDKRYFIYEEI